MEKDESHQYMPLMFRVVPRLSVSVKCTVARPVSVTGKLERSYGTELAKGSQKPTVTTQQQAKQLFERYPFSPMETLIAYVFILIYKKLVLSLSLCVCVISDHVGLLPASVSYEMIDLKLFYKNLKCLLMSTMLNEKCDLELTVRPNPDSDIQSRWTDLRFI